MSSIVRSLGMDQGPQGPSGRKGAIGSVSSRAKFQELRHWCIASKLFTTGAFVWEFLQQFPHVSIWVLDNCHPWDPCHPEWSTSIFVFLKHLLYLSCCFDWSKNQSSRQFPWLTPFEEKQTYAFENWFQAICPKCLPAQMASTSG